ncbi:purine-cytosine permease family protein [Lysinibacter cavernae]|uniref:NCS1 nucleoside transporter family n=1 Tax=Lysinibacter cavernae TaxID=1640652 RepID=A0A7X5R1V2_9MICO|nr:cytosine permease [Lysinibacter cavernae]NIH54049.1 NCS1 nucleoside transporter family [Lysinibacter cavernae]NIH54944.1 NCS1 nucleoside transporter family [Lysinibacter cavernae]
MSAPGTTSGSIWQRMNNRLDENSEGHGPIRGTLSLGRIGMIWLASNLVVTTMLTGTLFVPGVTFVEALIFIVLGTVLGAIVLVAVGTMGTRTGLSTMSLTRGSFGIKGSFVPVAANVVILMGWSWVQAMLAGVTVNYLVAEATGFSNPILFSVLCELVVVALAIFGHEGISKVEPWLGLVILAFMGYVFTVAFTSSPIAEYVAIPADKALGYTGVVVLDIVISTAISWTVLSADITRFAKTQKGAVLGTGIGYIVSTVLAMTLGVVAISYVILNGGEAVSFDPTIVVASFGAPLAIVILLSVLATNTMAVYGMVTSIVNAQSKRKIRFLPTALVVGFISIFGSSWLALLDQFTAFLTVIGSLFVPVFAIMIIDYYVINKGFYGKDILNENGGGRYWFKRGINWAAVIIWAACATLSFMLTYVWVSPIGATIPTFIVTVILYLSWSLATKRMVTERTPSTHLLDQGAAE